MRIRQHERLIDAAAEHGWQRRGLTPAIRVAARALIRRGLVGVAQDLYELNEVLRGVEFRPDAFRVRIEEPSRRGWKHPVVAIELLEVEVTYAISNEKTDLYASLFIAIDSCEFFHLRVLRMDRLGYIAPFICTIEQYVEQMHALYGKGGPWHERRSELVSA